MPQASPVCFGQQEQYGRIECRACAHVGACHVEIACGVVFAGGDTLGADRRLKAVIAEQKVALWRRRWRKLDHVEDNTPEERARRLDRERKRKARAANPKPKKLKPDAIPGETPEERKRRKARERKQRSRAANGD